MRTPSSFTKVSTSFFDNSLIALVSLRRQRPTAAHQRGGETTKTEMRESGKHTCEISEISGT